MWNPEVETLPRERMEALQLERLRAAVARVLARVPPLAARLRAAGIISPDDIRSLADLRRLPFTRKIDLREHYPFGLFAVPVAHLVRIHGSSGTRGKPTIVGYTRNDLAMWSEVVARCLALAGVRPGMVVHNAYGYGLFTGGLGLHQGAELSGCTVVPISGGLIQRQATLLQDLRGQVLCCTPSYALCIAEALETAQIDPRTLELEVGIFGAEPWSEELRGEIERRLGLAAVNIYGLAEIVGPGVSAECIEARNGSHIQEDHFLPEIVDPASGEPLGPGLQGELVLTTLTKRAMPVIRYRTGDITTLTTTPCRCGRTSARMGRLVGRADDMLIIKGVNVYPSEVEGALLDVADLVPQYVLVVDRTSTLARVELQIEPAPAFLERCRSLEPDHPEVGKLRGEVAARLRAALGLNVDVTLVPPRTIPRSEGKAVRVVERT